MTKFYGYTGEFSIRTSEIDTQKRIKIASLIKLMQETSMQNVLSLKLSVWDLEDEAMSWVLLKKDISVNSLPTVGETINIKTYPAGFERIFAYRDFIVYNSSLDIIITASSVWGLLNTRTRKLIKIPPYEFYNVIPDDRLDRPSFKLSENVKQHYSHKSPILWSHLDWNNHVNNIVLVQKMLDVIPPDFLYQHSIHRLSIQFKNESILGDELVSFCEINSQEVSHIIKRASDNAVIALAKTIWTA